MAVLIGGDQIVLFLKGTRIAPGGPHAKGGVRWTRTWLPAFFYKKFDETHFGIIARV